MKNLKRLTILSAALYVTAQLGLPTELAAAVVALVAAMAEADKQKTA